MPLHKNQIIPLHVDSISSDGSGVGRHEGKVVFVPLAAPGDELHVKIVKDVKSHAFARIEQIVTPGPARREMDCAAGRVCGGCCFRQMGYAAELAAKQGFVQDALRRLGGLDPQVLPILPSPAENRYRNRAQYPVAADGNGGLTYGFYATRSHRIVPCADCLLQSELLNQVASRTATLLGKAGASPYDETARTGLVRHICLREGGHTGEVSVCVVTTNGALPGAESIAATLGDEFPQIQSFSININAKDTNVIFGEKTLHILGDGTIRDVLCGVPLLLDPLTFSQVNTAGAERLFETAAVFAAVGPQDTLLDLYCGSGVIGLSMAGRCKALIGVETHPQSVRNAQASAIQMGLANTRFLAATAADAAAQLLAEGLRPDVITLDPPRKGCDETTLRAVAQMAPHRIVMVSCNPATLARDLTLLAMLGYATHTVQPVDMFPRTRHVEAVALLQKAEK